jgi:hypothetical protein
MNSYIIEKVIDQLKDMPREMQWRVLEFTRALNKSTPHGVPGQQLLRFAGVIPQEDVKLIKEVVVQNFARLDNHDW